MLLMEEVCLRSSAPVAGSGIDAEHHGRERQEPRAEAAAQGLRERVAAEIGVFYGDTGL
ncbi:MAG TPA: hypothetical protein VJN44_18825 [Roseateles sp.]|nr:hypothetical protein [Roseateles sp.]